MLPRMRVEVLLAMLPRRRRWRLPPSSLRSEGRSARAATAKNLVRENKNATLMVARIIYHTYLRLYIKKIKVWYNLVHYVPFCTTVF